MLIRASINDHLEVVKYLISIGANKEVTDGPGWTPLIYAAQHGNFEAVRYLISIGANFEAENSYGDTPLIQALTFGHIEIVKYLISIGANKEVKGEFGYTPQIDALKFGHFEIFKYLISIGADKEVKDNNGNTPLIIASEKGLLEFVNKCDYLQVTGRVNSNIGVNVRSGPGTNYGRVGGLGNNALVTIKEISSNWFRIDQGWVCADYIALSGSPGPAPGPAPGPSPSGQVIRQGDPRFNSNIRTWGCGFMSLCWCGGVNSIDGCNNLYNTAIRNGWMRSDCFILSWDAIKPIAGARGYRPGDRNAPVGGNEKEILECHNARTSMHFVVGNKNGGIEYDPAAPGFVSYGDHTSKRIYIY